MRDPNQRSNEKVDIMYARRAYADAMGARRRGRTLPEGLTPAQRRQYYIKEWTKTGIVLIVSVVGIFLIGLLIEWLITR